MLQRRAQNRDPESPRGLGPRWSGPQGRGPRTGREEGRARLLGFPRSGSRRRQKRKGGAGGQRGAPLGSRPRAPGGPRAIQRPLAWTRPDGDQSEEADAGASPVSSPPAPGCVTRGRLAEAMPQVSMETAPSTSTDRGKNSDGPSFPRSILLRCVPSAAGILNYFENCVMTERDDK